MENIKKLLNEEIEDEIDELGGLDLGSEPYKISVDGITKLMDRKIEIAKLELESQNQNENRKVNSELNENQLKNEKQDRLISNTIQAVGVVGGILVTVWGTCKTLKFDRDGGIISTTMGRGWINKLFPKK